MPFPNVCSLLSFLLTCALGFSLTETFPHPQCVGNCRPSGCVVSFICDGPTYSSFTVLFRCCLHQEGWPNTFFSMAPTSGAKCFRHPMLCFVKGILCEILHRLSETEPLSARTVPTVQYSVCCCMMRLYECLLIW